MASAVLKDGGSLGILVCGLVAVRQPGLSVTWSMRKVHVWLGFKKKKKKGVCESHSVMFKSLWPLPGSSVHGILQARILEWVAVPFSRVSSQPRDWTQVSCIEGRFGESGKSKNTGVGSLSLLQWIFPTQESNQSLLHCRWILYQLSYQGEPKSIL